MSKTFQPQNPETLHDLDYHIIRFLDESKKLLKCENCHNYGTKDDISAEKLNEIYKKIKNKVIKENKESTTFKEYHPIFLLEGFKFLASIKKSSGFYGDGINSPEWMCPNCEAKEPLKIKYYKELKEVLKMECELESCEAPDSILKKYPDIKYEGWEEFNQIFDVKKKKEWIRFDVNEDKVFTIYSEEEVKKAFTQKEFEDLKDRLVVLAKEISDSVGKQVKKIRSKYRWQLWDSDEGYCSYRKANLIIHVIYGDSSFSEAEITEIKDSITFALGDFQFEYAIDSNKNLIEALWKKEKLEPYEDKIYFNMRDYKFVPYDFSEKLFNIVHASDNYKKINKEDVYKKLIELFHVIQWGGEFPLDFANYEFRLYAGSHYKIEKDKQYSFQYRKKYSQEPFSETIYVNNSGHHLNSLRNIYDNMLKWIDAYTKKAVIDTKITSTGSDSRHIILDKKEGLPLFFGFEDLDDKRDISQYFPDEVPIRVEYFTDKIIIEKKK